MAFKMMPRWSLLGLAAIPLVLSALRPGPPASVEWWTTHGLHKVQPLEAEPTDAAHMARIAAARNEFEPFQVVLRAEGGNFDDVDVEVTDLRGEAGTIPSENSITVYAERFLNLTTPSSETGGTGEWPDPLVPRIDRYANEKRSAFPLKLISGRNQPLWIDVYVPPSAAPGTYHGQVRIRGQNKFYAAIPVELEVWNFELPSTSSLPTTFGFSGVAADRAHYGKYTSDADIYALANLYGKAALWHRISLSGGNSIAPVVTVNGDNVRLDWAGYDNALGPFLNGEVFKAGQPLHGARVTSVSMSTLPQVKTNEQKLEFWRQTARHFREKGWFDRLFDYVWDEPTPKQYPAVIELAKLVRAADPEIKNLVTTALHPDWSDFVDIWTPPINCFERKPHHDDFCTTMAERSAYDAELAKRKELWWYQACGSHGCDIIGGDYFRGWPDYMIDDEPVRNRIMEWLTWKYGIHGELYFNTNEAYSRKKEPWKDVHLFGGNGDGTLFYPGRPDIIGGSTQIPIESIRLKLIREGLEDYEYLAILTKLAGYDAVAEHVNQFVHKTYDFDQDPKALYAVREWMGREISKRLK